MRKFLQEFKEFAMRGNVMDLAVGVIIGAVMKATRGQADAKAVTKVVMGKIKG